jgi:hypothetical protein
MTYTHPRLATLVLLMAVAAAPALAASSASSAASDSITTSVGSSSDSVKKSSDSSSGKDEKVAEGDYTIVEVAAATQRPGTVRLKLQPVADGAKKGEFFLFMPQEAFDQSRLGPGHVITAKPRAYGIQFTRAASQQAFFLVLDDEQYRELQTKVVSL